MVAEIDFLSEWIPEKIGKGTLYILENAGEMGQAEDPYFAVLGCPECGVVGLITRRQIAGLISVICGSNQCSAEYFINNDDIVPRRPA